MRYEKLKSKQLSRSPDTPASTSECRSYTSDSGPQCRRARTQSSRTLWSGDTPEERPGTRPSSLPCALAARHAAGPDSGREQFPTLRPGTQRSSRKRQSSHRVCLLSGDETQVPLPAIVTANVRFDITPDQTASAWVGGQRFEQAVLPTAADSRHLWPSRLTASHQPRVAHGPDEAGKSNVDH